MATKTKKHGWTAEQQIKADEVWFYGVAQVISATAKPLLALGVVVGFVLNRTNLSNAPTPPVVAQPISAAPRVPNHHLPPDPVSERAELDPAPTHRGAD